MQILNGERNGKCKEYRYQYRYQKLGLEKELIYYNGILWNGKEYDDDNHLIYEGEYLNHKKWKGKFKEYSHLNFLMSEGEYIKDPEQMTFVFSLDNKKIYDLKDVDYAVHHYFNYGPYFGNGDICIKGNPIQETKLSTSQMSYDYKGDKSTLSESSFNIKALEYEIFQVLFE